MERDSHGNPPTLQVTRFLFAENTIAWSGIRPGSVPNSRQSSFPWDIACIAIYDEPPAGPCNARDRLPEVPSIKGQQDRVQQPDRNKAEPNSIDEEGDIAGQMTTRHEAGYPAAS
jgi:hypothetical protein